MSHLPNHFNQNHPYKEQTLSHNNNNRRLNKAFLNPMARSIQFILSFCSYTIIRTIILTSIPRCVQSKTLESDIQVLRFLKQSIDPITISSSSFLNTWTFENDPCESSGAHFLGILCTIPHENSSSRISAIDLEGEGLEGFLTSTIGNLTELTTINLSRNKFRGPIPNTLSNLENLNRLVLADNFFSGSIPNRINRLWKLGSIDLSRNRLSGSIPAVISAFRSLTLLRLSNNELSGRIPELTGLWQLSTLDLSGNQLYGNLPQLPISLRSLLLGHNLLSGEISSIMRLQHLKTLDLSDNRFSGLINQEIITLPEVSRLNVSENQFTTMAVMRSTDRSTQLQVLDMHGNRVHGHLPANLITYGNLTSINLGNNLFSGRIPLQYGEKVGGSWRSLYLDHNFLEGGLPPEFGSRALRIRGSLAQNCLRCPLNNSLCHGGQRAASECVGHSGGDSA
ncbi:unnamed protein product [Ilex paraguariensis]|uniref:Leucine-rich repeat receptor-like protein kinase n=1 Tax=Ilex paraguariensis TaxID=185542 RepID=A0ABC8T3G5_9AQUA